MRKFALALLFLTSSVVAGEALDNAAVLRLVASGLSADIIVLKIERSQTRFDTSTDGLIALKDARVPDVVIRAMILRGDAQSSAATPAAAPATTAPATDPPTTSQTAATPSHPAPATAVVSQPAPSPSGVNATCATVKFYTLAAGGWGWTPAYVCVGASSLSVDEQEVPFAQFAVQCTSKPSLLSVGGSMLRGDQEWWLSDDKETFKFQGKPEDLDRLSEALTRSRRDLPHGGCNDRAVRKLLR